MEKIKVFDCFAGYGGAEFALQKAGIEHECVGFSEIDKYAIQCFKQNHPGVKHYGDITKIDWSKVPEFDLLCGGFPCQDISVAGKQDLSKGRSVLINELIRCLKEKQPRYFLFENVGAIETEPFREFLRGIENDLKDSGYRVYRKSMNSKDYGIPQNRVRVWWIGYRKDLEHPGFGWTPYPKECELVIELKDLLEKNVDEKYFLTESQFNYVKKHSESRGKPLYKRINPSVSPCVTLKQTPADSAYISNSGTFDFGFKEISPCLCARDGRGPKIVATITTENAHGFGKNVTPKQVISINNSIGELRRLTPVECFRLMGFFDDEINLDGLSDTQRYRLAGNGWDVNLVSKIFSCMEMK